MYISRPNHVHLASKPCTGVQGDCPGVVRKLGISVIGRNFLPILAIPGWEYGSGSPGNSIKPSIQEKYTASRSAAVSTRGVTSANRIHSARDSPNDSPGIPATPASSINRSTFASVPGKSGNRAIT